MIAASGSATAAAHASSFRTRSEGHELQLGRLRFLLRDRADRLASSLRPAQRGMHIIPAASASVMTQSFRLRILDATGIDLCRGWAATGGDRAVKCLPPLRAFDRSCSPMMPEPTTAVTRSPVPRPSATARRARVGGASRTPRATRPDPSPVTGRLALDLTVVRATAGRSLPPDGRSNITAPSGGMGKREAKRNGASRRSATVKRNGD